MCYDHCKYTRADGECMLPEPTGCNCAEGHGDECECDDCFEDADPRNEREYYEER